MLRLRRATQTERTRHFELLLQHVERPAKALPRAELGQPFRRAARNPDLGRSDGPFAIDLAENPGVMVPARGDAKLQDHAGRSIVEAERDHCRVECDLHRHCANLVGHANEDIRVHNKPSVDVDDAQVEREGIRHKGSLDCPRTRAALTLTRGSPTVNRRRRARGLAELTEGNWNRVTRGQDRNDNRPRFAHHKRNSSNEPMAKAQRRGSVMSALTSHQKWMTARIPAT